MSDLEILHEQTYQALLTTISPSMHERTFDSFSEREALVLINNCINMPVAREAIISCDPETEDPRLDTVAQAVRFIVPRVVSYANRNEITVPVLIEIGHEVGLRHIYIHDTKAFGLSLWKPVIYKLKDTPNWISDIR